MVTVPGLDVPHAAGATAAAFLAVRRGRSPVETRKPDPMSNSHPQSSAASRAVGVLDLQGDVVEHLDHFERLGTSAVPVRTPDQLEALAGLVIPGGESTCLSRLMRLFAFDEAIRRAFAGGLKLWGTCAGAILLATRVRGEKAHLGLIDIEIQRNAFGSQLDSFTATADVPSVAAAPVPLTFIRAPKILEAGPGVDVLLHMDDYIAAAESDGVLVTVFHPELTPCLAFHRYFLCKCGLTPIVHGRGPVEVDPEWRLTSWTRQTRLAPTGPGVTSPR